MTTHCRPDSDIPRSVWIEGSATFTIVASRITMNCARQTRTRTSHGLTRPAFTALDATGRPGVCAYGYPSSRPRTTADAGAALPQPERSISSMR